MDYKRLDICDGKIKNWDGWYLDEFAATFDDTDVNAMIDWMNSECPFDIAADYFESIEKSSGYEIMREEVISNYIRRNLMYMIDQTDTKKAAHWYEIWHRMCSW